MWCLSELSLIIEMRPATCGIEALEGKRWLTSTLIYHPFTFKHLADVFIHSGYTFFCMCSLGIEPMTFCAANAVLYHWATGTSIWTVTRAVPSIVRKWDHSGVIALFVVQQVLSDCITFVHTRCQSAAKKHLKWELDCECELMRIM